MNPLLNALLVVVLALNLFALGTSRLVTVIKIVSLQGVLLGLMPFLIEGHLGWRLLLASGGTILLKGGIIPFMMIRAMRDVQIKREMEPLIGFLPSMLLGALATGFALLFSKSLPLASAHTTPLLVPASLATIFVGFILLTTRAKAITQVMGYLVLENGIYIFGMLLMGAMPLVVELGVLLDLFVAVFVICIIINHINQAFSSLDTRRLVALKE
ncbi:hydrogenase [Pontiella sulfatireligans]|uniref:Hydrogenase-4 component E n=1 Tax=Pontiella sulfatireligans TaxID=2750658 RepID=A0A6C2UK54_9BACT|nr:hydrogenase [Pontiella sulfatireligans]VGO20612.1 Hydrogenase-4 component E [Pontiella sulfatireligans]